MFTARTFARLTLVVLIATTASVGLAFERHEVVGSFTAAAIVYVPAWGDLEGNIERITTAVDEAGRDGIKLAVFPEQATIGYIFDDFAMVKPYLDTIPGKTTEAVAAMTRKHKMYAVVGIAEIDPDSGLGYNSAALVGPDGYIGKYRKTGLNSQDQRWASPGNLGYPVFDTELGRLMLLICYDDTYWQYARMASLHGVDVIAWISASDRVMPGTPKSKSKGDHSTVAGVQVPVLHQRGMGCGRYPQRYRNESSHATKALLQWRLKHLGPLRQQNCSGRGCPSGGAEKWSSWVYRRRNQARGWKGASGWSACPTETGALWCAVIAPGAMGPHSYGHVRECNSECCPARSLLTDRRIP